MDKVEAAARSEKFLSKRRLQRLLAHPLLEALPASLRDRPQFDGAVVNLG